MRERFEQFSYYISGIYRHVQKIERTEMERLGLKGPHVQCLLALRCNPGGLTSSRLCTICDKDKAAISRTLAELEQENLVTREFHNGNRYRAILKLTERGQMAASQVEERVTIAVEKAGEGLTDDQREVFYKALELIARNLQSISEDGLQEREKTEVL